MPQGQVHSIREAYPAALNKEGIATLAGNECDVQREPFGADSQKVAFCPRQESTGNQRYAHGHLDHEIHVCLEARTSPETRSQKPSEVLDDD